MEAEQRHDNDHGSGRERRWQITRWRLGRSLGLRLLWPARGGGRRQRASRPAPWRAPAASRERLGELGFLVDGAFLGEGAEPFLVVALEVVDEVGVGPVRAFRPKARLAAGDRGPHLEVVAVAFVVGKDRRHRSGGRLGPVRQGRHLAARGLRRAVGGARSGLVSWLRRPRRSLVGKAVGGSVAVVGSRRLALLLLCGGSGLLGPQDPNALGRGSRGSLLVVAVCHRRSSQGPHQGRARLGGGQVASHAEVRPPAAPSPCARAWCRSRPPRRG